MSVKIVIPKTISFTKAIKNKCLDCCCGTRTEVRDCEIYHCPLFPYRFGMKPDSYVKSHPRTIIISEKGRKVRERKSGN